MLNKKQCIKLLKVFKSINDSGKKVDKVMSEGWKEGWKEYNNDKT